MTEQTEEKKRIQPRLRQHDDQNFRLTQSLGALHRWFAQNGNSMESFPERGVIPPPRGRVRLLTLAFNRHLQDLQKWCKRMLQSNSRLRAENERLQEEVELLRTANAELEKFAATAAHDVKSPLLTLRNAVELVNDDEQTNLSNTSSEVLELAANAAENAAAIVDGLLDWARSSSRAPACEALDIRQIVNEVCSVNLREAINEAGATVRVPRRTQRCVGSRDQVSIVLQNLIENSLKYRKLTVDPLITVRTFSDSRTHVRVEVTDNGQGVSEVEQKRIFKSFSRGANAERKQGLGLGLSHARTLIRENGGHMGVRSEKGSGTTVWFTLPKKTHFARPAVQAQLQVANRHYANADQQTCCSATAH